MRAALPALLCLLAGASAGEQEGQAEERSTCGTARGQERAEQRALGGYLRSLAKRPSAPVRATVLSEEPMILELPVRMSIPDMLAKLVEQQPADREDGWAVSPKDAAAAPLLAAALAGTLGPPFDSSYLEPLQTLRTRGRRAYEHTHDWRAEHVSSPWGPRLLSIHIFLNEVEGGGGGLHFPHAGENPCGDDSTSEQVRKRECGLVISHEPGKVVLWPNVLLDDVLCPDRDAFHRTLPAALPAPGQAEDEVEAEDEELECAKWDGVECLRWHPVLTAWGARTFLHLDPWVVQVELPPLDKKSEL